MQPPFSAEQQEKMRETARRILGRIKGDSSSAEQQLSQWDGQSSLMIELSDITLHVYADQTTSIFFHQEVVLPADLMQISDPIQQTEAIGTYVSKQYGAWLGMTDVQVAVNGGDLQADGSRLYQLKFYDRAGTQAQQLVQYELGAAEIGVSGQTLSVIHLHSLPEEEALIGEYPLIQEAKAREKLLAGDYLTVGFAAEQPRSDMVEQVTLVYHAQPSEPYVMPYYRYLVRQEGQTEADGTKLLAAYYVPAVEEAYLAQ